jgi:hypothetical protein
LWAHCDNCIDKAEEYVLKKITKYCTWGERNLVLREIGIGAILTNVLVAICAKERRDVTNITTLERRCFLGKKINYFVAQI